MVSFSTIHLFFFNTLKTVKLVPLTTWLSSSLKAPSMLLKRANSFAVLTFCHLHIWVCIFVQWNIIRSISQQDTPINLQDSKEKHSCQGKQGGQETRWNPTEPGASITLHKNFKSHFWALQKVKPVLCTYMAVCLGLISVTFHYVLKSSFLFGYLEKKRLLKTKCKYEGCTA